MSGKARRVTRLRLGALSERELAVTAVAGSEALSEPFRFEVDFFATSEEPIDLEPLVAAEACLSLSRPGGAERFVNGVCVRAEHVGVLAGVARYRAVIGPKLLLLDHGRASRVFQERSVPEIVKAVLDEGGVRHRSAVRGSYQTREMCVRYRETGLEFVTRLLAEEGIAYWFEHEEGGHELVLGDAPGAFGPLAGGDALPYREESAAAGTEEYLFDLRCTQRVKPGKATLRDFDFERPALDVTAEAAEGEGAEVYEYPGRYTDQATGKRLSQVRLEELRLAAETWTGAGTCARLVPGSEFGVTGHPRFGARLVAVRVEHEGRQQASAGDVEEIDDTYRNRFLAIEAGQPYRPRRQRARTGVARSQTATVVGPGEEEVHPDRHGRVKLQFHWDREGKRDDRSSAWVRLAQGWAGAGFGATFVPRVGQEVLVRFLEGDPDRPLVCGAIYNGENPVPIQLPEEKTRSTLRTATSPGCGGSNELRFEDAKGAEEVYLHAQRDHAIEVRNDKGQRVLGAEALVVEGDRSQTVHGEQRLRVTLVDTSGIGGNRALEMRGDRTTAVRSSHSEVVGLAQTVKVDRNRTVRVDAASTEWVGAAAALNVGVGYEVNVGGLFNKAVGGAFTGEVGGARVEIVGAARTERVGGDSRAKVGGDFVSDVTGMVSASTGKDLREEISGATEVEATEPVSGIAGTLTLEAAGLSLVVNGKVALRMDGSGTIQLAGSSVTVDGAEIKLKGSRLQKVVPAALRKQQIEVQRLEELGRSQGPPKDLRVRLLGGGVARAGKRYTLELDDGTKREGTTDGSGCVVEKIPATVRTATVKIEVPDLGVEEWVLRLGELDPISSMRGVQQRLRNSGFHCDPNGMLDDDTRGALALFQEDQGLEPTGELDDATRQRLGEVHGS